MQKKNIETETDR